MDAFIKNMNYLFIALLTIYPVIQLFSRYLIWWKKVIIGVVVFLFLLFAYLNYGVEKKETNDASDLANRQHSVDTANFGQLSRKFDSLKNLNPPDVSIQQGGAGNKIQMNGNVFARNGMTLAMRDSMQREQNKRRSR